MMIRMILLLSNLAFVRGMALHVPKSETKTATLLSRRNALITGAATITASNGVSFVKPQLSAAIELDISEEEALKGPPERISLLKELANGGSDKNIFDAIAALESLDPSDGKAALSENLGGTWELIYSIDAESFSPLLNLPKPIRPTSLQLIGEDAASVVGPGRIAQVLNFPILPLSFILSSATAVVDADSSVLEIFPPFRFDVKFGGIKTQVIQSGSDADFRALNGRSSQAQAAGRNIYKQRYLETSGERGDLRISEVIAGDPVIVVSCTLYTLGFKHSSIILLMSISNFFLLKKIALFNLILGRGFHTSTNLRKITLKIFLCNSVFILNIPTQFLRILNGHTAVGQQIY